MKPRTEAGRRFVDQWKYIALAADPSHLIAAIEAEAVAAFVWDRLESTPGFNEEMASALEDVKAGRVTAWADVKARMDAERRDKGPIPPHRSAPPDDPIHRAPSERG